METNKPPLKVEAPVVVREGLNYRTAAFIGLIVFAVGFVAGFAISRKYSPVVELPVVTIQRDTVTVRDTIRGKVQPPTYKTVLRVDTIKLQMRPHDGGIYKNDSVPPKNRDTSNSGAALKPQDGISVIDGRVFVDISRKVYKTADYRAVVSGWRASLDSIELYRDTRTITENRLETRNVIKRPWLALIAGGGVGYTPQKQIVPFAGVGIGIVLKSW